MRRMPHRGVLLIVLGMVTLAATWLGVFTPSQPPQVSAQAPGTAPSGAPSATPPQTSTEALQAEEPAPTVKTSTVTLRRGDTLLAALGRGGIDRRASNDIAAALRAKKDSSMRIAIDLIKSGEVQACVSASASQDCA